MSGESIAIRRLVISLVVFACLGWAGVAQAVTSVCPDMDLDGDCRVDFNDFAIFVLQWMAQRLDCSSGYEDCDDFYYNGCETHVAADINNCGGCGIVCNLPRATADCVDGNCVPAQCDAGYDDCDGVPGNGCETDLMNDRYNCGSCGYVCNLPHADEACQGGQCVVYSCDNGYANCDGIHSNGCERDLSDDGGGCPAAQYLGSVVCDSSCQPGPSDTSYASRWYRIFARDDSSGGGTLWLRVRLQPPMGTDYDLYLYDDNCSSGPIRSSTLGGSSTEQIDYDWTDNLFSDDSRYFRIEVRFYDGSSCSNWSLQTWGGCPP